MGNMDIWRKVCTPPPDALKKILGGRLKGMTDISPQWRLKILTYVFGPCGEGWSYEIKRIWNEAGSDGQVFAFAEINLQIGSDIPIPGIGGSMLVVKEKSGLHSNDEGYKMAVTDAISVAAKALGVGADIYLGLWDGDRYTQSDDPQYITEQQLSQITDMINAVEADEGKFLSYLKVESLDKIPTMGFDKAMAALKAKEKKERTPGEEG